VNGFNGTGYVVIYDTGPYAQPREEYYGYFNTPEEARRMFFEAFTREERKASLVRNVRLCQIVQKWLTEWEET